ncbi:MAG: Ig-like domain-containing protein, partial [Bacteroidota bacterium]
MIKKCLIVFGLMLGYALFSQKASAQLITVKPGSFLINMGATNPQTIANGLKPYGLIYDLIRNHSVPVIRVIGQGKPKDGTDFIYNGVAYKGGSFIILKEYISVAVSAKISSWMASGVVGAYTTSTFQVNSTYILTAVPTWTLDAQNGDIAEEFLANAGITNTAFPNAFNWKTPAQLNNCNDLYVMPHADPTWAVHSNLYYWNTNSKGSIWLGCHATSVLENLTNGLPSSNPNYIRTNFLTTNGLIPFGSQSNGSVPYTHCLFSDPCAQYIGSTDNAQLNGSEQIFIPQSASVWRPTTKILAYDPSQADVPVLNPNLSNAAAVIVYGRAYGDNSKGLVMYEGGHDINNGATGSVAAQRAFFDFCLLQTFDKIPFVVSINWVKAPGDTAVLPASFTSPPAAYRLTATITSPVGAAPFTYLWTVSSGSFSATDTNVKTSTSACPVYYPPIVTSDCPIVLSVKARDICGRESFIASPSYTVLPRDRAPVPNPDNASIVGKCAQPGSFVVVPVLDNDTDPDGDPLHVSAVNGSNGTWTTNGTTVTFYPSTNFFGTAWATYTVCDTTYPVNMCSSAVITVGVGSPDVNGCFPGSLFSIVTDDTVKDASTGSVSITGASGAQGHSNYLQTDAATYALINNSLDELVMDFGSIKSAYDSVAVFFASETAGSPVTIQVQYATASNTGPWSILSSASTSLVNPVTVQRFAFPSGGIRYLKIVRTAGSANVRIDAAALDDYSCVTAIPFANTDILTVYEDIPSKINVLANDVNPGNLALTMSIISLPSHGMISLNIDNTISYVNNADYPSAPGDASDLFIYQICNSQGLCDTARVILRIKNDECTAGNYKPYGWGSPITTTFVNAAAADVTVRDAMADQFSTRQMFNYGGSTTIKIGKLAFAAESERGLFQFTTLSSIPADAMIQSAVFSINRTAGLSALTFGVHRVTESWTEGSETGAASTGGVTWSNRSNATPWAPTAGGTFVAAPEATTLIQNVNGYKDFSIVPLVQGWVNGTFPNYGLLVQQVEAGGSSEDLTFGTSENTTSGNRPKLTVTYFTSLPCTATPNRAPMANSDTATVLSGNIRVVPVLNNDRDPDGNVLSLVSIANPPPSAQGTAVISGFNIVFTANAAFTGSSKFKYIVQDNGAGNLKDTAEVNVTVRNSPPSANQDLPSVLSNSVNNVIDVQSNDANPDGPNPWFTSINSPPNHGSASVSGNNIIYTPYWGFTGKDTLIYNLCEPADPNVCVQGNLCDTAKVIITVANQRPMAVSETVTILPCDPSTVNLTDNDSDPEGGVLSIGLVSGPVPSGAGTLINNHDGTITFDPVTGFLGTVTVTYSVTDNGTPPMTSLSTATLTINVVNPSNNVPVANADLEDMNMDQTDYFSVLDNDFDPDGQSLTNPAVTIQPVHGTASVLMNGSIRYKPNPGFFGIDWLVYRIYDLVINPATCSLAPTLSDTAIVRVDVNTPPLVEAVNDQNSTWQDVNCTGQVMTNDFDPFENLSVVFDGFFDSIGNLHTTGNLNVYAIDGITLAGVLSISNDGSYSFDPATSFVGQTTIPYQIHHDYLYNVTDQGVLQITVNPLPQQSNSVIASNDEYVSYGAAVIGNILINDGDPQGQYFGVTSLMVDHDGIPGTLPVAGLLSTPVISGGVTSAGNPTTGAGTLLLNPNGTFTFTPINDFHGEVVFTYTICDADIPAACSSAILSFDVIPDTNGSANNAPFAGDDFSFIPVNSQILIDYYANDNDTDGDSLSLNGVKILPGGPHTAAGSLIATAAGGTMQFFADGTCTYVPPANFSGPDYVTYKLCDNGVPSLCANATIYLLCGGQADMSVIKTAIPDTAAAGQLLTYSIIATNNGPGTAFNVVIVDNVTAFPSPEYAADSAGPWSAWQGSFNVGILGVNESDTIFIRGTLSTNQCDEVMNVASVGSSTPDTYLVNNNDRIMTVILDHIPPYINCPVNQQRNNNVGVCTYTAVGAEFDPLNYNDNCGGVSITYSLTGVTIGNGLSSLTGVVFNNGITTVTWTVTDLSGNSSSCSFNVQVNDNTAPSITCAVSETQNVSAGANCTYTHTGTSWDATATDNCGIKTLTFALSGATGGSGTSLNNIAFNKGTTTVTWIAVDSANNSVNCSFNVQVNDNTNPVIICAVSGTQNVSAGANCTYTHTGTSWDATATDNCGIKTLTFALSGATGGLGTSLNNITFNKGTTTVTWTAVDSANNSVNCSFNVQVNDNTNPVIICAVSGTQNVSAGANCTYTHTGTSWDATAADNCGIKTLTFALSGATGGSGTSLNNITFNKGITTVTWTAADSANNSVNCSFNVQVNDNTNPVIICAVSGTQNVSAGANCTYTHTGTSWDATAADNCGIKTLTFALSGATGGSGTS